jgi:hypothetical protein
MHCEGDGSEASCFWRDTTVGTNWRGAGGRTPSWYTSPGDYVRARRWTSAAAKGATRSGSPSRAGA